MNPLCFFAHIAFFPHSRSASSAEATANLLIEIDDATLRSGGEAKDVEFSTMSDRQKVDFASEMGKTAALDFVDLEPEFSELPVRRFVDFDLTEMPNYLSVRESPTRTLPNQSKVWRLAQLESDKLRTKPLSRTL